MVMLITAVPPSVIVEGTEPWNNTVPSALYAVACTTTAPAGMPLTIAFQSSLPFFLPIGTLYGVKMPAPETFAVTWSMSALVRAFALTLTEPPLSPLCDEQPMANVEAARSAAPIQTN